ncbi:two-component system sensor histidine kinase NtrB [Halomontanus rarus]|uniref:two-component system sensor histidine kinase NtrB n=1 Tax=Halomontanus rarus TaxID=3034020 RepID=UPI0023E81346|nr:PAS domain-containing sensor histidine kinase [Halovivax sp. TS33]
MEYESGSLSDLLKGQTSSETDTNFFRTLIANTSEGLLTIDSNSTIIFANPAIEDILGYSPTELVGSSKLEIIPERLRATHERQLQRYIETGEKNIDWDGVHLPALHKDGHEVPVMVSLREHEFENTRLFTGVFRDISELKDQEARLERQNERLERFASVLSHDVRNPLNVAQAYTDTLRDELDRQEVAETAAALERIENIVDDMLLLTNADRSVDSVEQVFLEEIVTKSWQWVSTADAKLVVEDPTDTIRVDQSQCMSLLENLFNNAVSHGGSAVTVRVGTLNGSEGFYVEDDGQGIPEKYRGDVFEHGFTTSTDGTGLGLSIVQEIALAHDWTVTMTDSSEGGARFEFHFENITTDL